MASGAVTKKIVYETSQTDTVLMSPASSKSIFVWRGILKTTESGDTIVKFATSGDIIISGIKGNRANNNINMEGAVDEEVLITCPANTTVILLVDEIS